MTASIRRRALTALSVVAGAGVFAAALGAPAPDARAAEVYGFDKNHSEIIFGYSHLGNSTQHGSFERFDGTIEIDAEEPANSRVEVVIEAASLDTGVAALDDNLRGASFFDVGKHPEIRFVSTAVKRVSKSQVEIEGELTIKDVTGPVVLVATLNYMGEHPLSAVLPAYAGKHVAGFSARAQLLRSEFGLGMSVPLTGDLIDLTIETELFRVEP